MHSAPIICAALCYTAPPKTSPECSSSIPQYNFSFRTPFEKNTEKPGTISRSSLSDKRDTPFLRFPQSSYFHDFGVVFFLFSKGAGYLRKKKPIDIVE